MQDYVVVFDLAEVGYRQWTFPAFGLPFLAVGALLVRYRNKVATAAPAWARAAFSFFFFGFALLWITVSFVSTYGEYRTLRSALEEGRAAVAEGPVEDFVPMPDEGHAMESFTVAGESFEYSDYVVTTGFNNTSSHGGPIQPGRQVRITHFGGHILRLEVQP